MKVSGCFTMGDIVSPLPKSFTVRQNQLVLPDGETVRHGDDFNVTILSHFLVAVRPIREDDEIVLNFNLAFYDMVKNSDEDIFFEPVVPGFRYLDEREKQSLYLFADECVRKQATADGFVPRGMENSIDVVRSKMDALIAVSNRDHESDALVFESTGVLLPFPVRSTVEVPGDMHLRLTGGSEFIQHSCLPNIRLEIVDKLIRGVALRPIHAGERLTFNYLCTEWEVTKMFHCSCNKYCCYGVIRGFKYLDRGQQEHILPHCSQAVREKYCAPLLASASLAAMEGGNSAIATASTGRIVAQRHIPAGTVLCQATAPPRIEGNEMILGGVRLPHSCDASTVLLEDKLVTSRPLLGGDSLTFNINLLQSHLSEPFDCSCGAAQCQRSVRGFSALPSDLKSRLWIYATHEVRNKALQDDSHLTFGNALVAVRSNGSMGQATFARQNICGGSRVFHVSGLILPFPTVYTIYLGEGRHLLFAEGAQCLAHSCNPNTRIVVDPISGCIDCFATEDIDEGALISFNYLTTEWDMDAPFQCLCGHKKCFGRISGFRHLSHTDQLRLWPSATNAVRSLFAQTHSASSVLGTMNTEIVQVCGDGNLCTVQDLPSGTLLFEYRDAFQLSGATVSIGDVSIRHSCSPSAALMGSRVVLRHAVAAGTAITLNINELTYELPHPFKCDCGSEDCTGAVGGFGSLADHEKDAIILCTQPDVRAEAIAKGYRNKSCSSLVTVRANGDMGQATFATSAIRAGTRFFRVTGLVVPFPTVYTILLEPGKHLTFAGGAQCLAHSCNPNVRVMVDPESRSLDCLALRDIAEGELISFNYLTTEWDMSTPFQCVCGHSKCFGKIRGFKHLSYGDRQMLWSTASPAVRQLSQSSPNWRMLTSSQLHADGRGRVRASKVLHEGTPLLSANRFRIERNAIVVDDIVLRHSCQPTAALIECRVVLVQTVCADAEITVDLTCLAYKLQQPFECDCGHTGGPHQVNGFAGLDEQQAAARIIFTETSVRAASLQKGFKVPCSCPLVTIKANGDMGQATFASTGIAAGTHFMRVKGLSIPFPTVYTIMLTETRHLLFADGAQCLAHSCQPNVRICVDAVNNTLECEALCDISPGELISFNYNTTEWDMNTPFRCLCGSKNCVYDIRGFKHLTRAQRETIQSHATPAVHELAGTHADVQLPHRVVKASDAGYLHAATELARETVVLNVYYLDIQPTQIGIGRNYTIPHSNEYNCVLVEGRIVAARTIQPGEALTVNMNFFVYDMTAMFPLAREGLCMGFKYLPDDVKQRNLYLCEPPVRAQAMRDGWLVKSTQSMLTVRPNGDMGQTAYATQDIPVGTKLFHCTGLVVPFPTMYTICVGQQKHLLFGDAAECIAHHCDPNVRVVVHEEDGTFDFVTIKPIHCGDMVTFNYTSTEWDMNTPFVCLCGSDVCAGTVKGFKHLTDAHRQRLWPITSDVVKSNCEKVE